MDLFKSLAQKKSPNNPVNYQLWSQSLDFARSSLSQTVLSDLSLLKLAEASETVEDFNLIAKYLYLSSKTQPDPGRGCQSFFKAVDESNYSLKEWISTISTFDSYLKEQKKSASFLVMLGYVQCCSESPGNKGVKRGLRELLLEMLSQYGFEAAKG